MNKFLRRLIIAFFLGFSLLATGIAFASNHADSIEINEMSLHDYLIENYGYAFIQNHNHALEMISELYGLFPTSRMGATIYPAYFGGLYINEDGELVILKLEDGLSNSNTMIARFEDAIIKPAEFSYQALVATMDFLNATITDPVMSNTSAWSLDVIGNQVVVALIDYNPDAIDLFRNTILDSPIITFEQGDIITMDGVFHEEQRQEMAAFSVPLFGTTRPSATQPMIQNPRPQIRTGDQIWFYRAGRGWIDHLSVGYRASNLWGEPGFVSAAHRDVPFLPLPLFGGGLQVGDIVTNHFGARIGVVHQARLQGIDAIFVATDPGVVVHSHGPLTYDGIVVGQLVLSRGAQSGYQFATILNANTSASVGTLLNPIRIDQGIRADINLIDGDSGGVVYTVTVNPHTNMAEVRGIAGINIAGNGLLANGLFSRADNINRILHLSLR
ncbi:MAG: S1 family peptidase [Defluviitaleaceae bacterium]|nr:S1 family peptidase [Defluviitaleaceae bacterium]